MINTLYMANFIQNKLNENSQDLKFMIFSDEGDLKQSYRKYGEKVEYTHGLLQIISDNIVPFANLEFQEINTQMMILVDLESEGYTEIVEGDIKRKQSVRLIKVKDCLDELLKKVNGRSYYVDIDGKSYNLTILMGKATDGTKMSLGEINDGYPLYINIQFVVFQNGVNSNSCNIIINGENIGYTQLVKSKIPTADESAIANEGTKAYILAGGKSFDLVAPLLDRGVTFEFVQYLLSDDTNTAFNVRLEYLDPVVWSKSFICVCGKCQETDVKGSNVGLNISLLEGIADILEYDDRWDIREVEGTEASVSSESGYSILSIYWGDGTSDILEPIEPNITHTYTDGINTHTIRIFKER